MIEIRIKSIIIILYILSPSINNIILDGDRILKKKRSTINPKIINKTNKWDQHNNFAKRGEQDFLRYLLWEHGQTGPLPSLPIKSEKCLEKRKEKKKIH